jgi:hypothetical protein
MSHQMILDTISISDLSSVSGGQGDPAPKTTPGSPGTQAVKDATRMVSSGVDVFRGTKSVRETTDGAMSGWEKGRALPASNGFQRFVNGVGGAAIEAFNLGW